MLARVASRLADLAERIVPDPFVIALLLTVLASGLGWLVMPAPSLAALADGWWQRFADVGTLAFTTQMALVLVAGSALVRAPLVAALLRRLADLPRTTRSAAALTAFVAMLAALLNWGFGLIVGAVLAREIGARARAAGRPLDYPLVGAAGYVGLMVWHGGLSGSAPLKVTEGTPAGGPPIPLDQTLFSPLNLGLCAALLLFVPWVLARMASDARERLLPELGVAPRQPPPDVERRPLAGRLLALFVVGLGGLALVGEMRGAGVWWQALNLNAVILLLLLTGLLLFGTPQRLAYAFGSSAGECAGILLQFPFYFGILGLLEASGLVALLAHRSVSLVGALAAVGLPEQFSFDLVTFVSAAIVNCFVPSGGGQWAVQGPIVLEAAADLGLSPGRAVLALAYGDQWTNMIQPFWALPLLATTGLKAREIFGYGLAVMLASGVVFLLAFALL